MKKLVLPLFCIFLAVKINAQDIFYVLSAKSTPDASKFLQDYYRPFAEGAVYDMYRGWYSSGKVHKKFGFDFTISIQAAVIPNSAKNFNFNNSDYSTLKLNANHADGFSDSLPTYVGSSKKVLVDVVDPTNANKTIGTFTTAHGFDYKYDKLVIPLAVPLPVVQIGFSPLKNTDIKLRYLPKFNVDDYDFQTFGVGVQHEFSGYIPFLKKLPFLHASILAAYNSVNAHYLPKLDTSSNQLLPITVQSTNNNFEYKVTTFTVQGIISAKFSFVEPYVGFGYYSGSNTINVNGDYNIAYGSSGQSNTTIHNPLSIAYHISGPSTTMGLRLNLGGFHIFSDWTVASYNGGSFGFTFGGK